MPEVGFFWGDTPMSFLRYMTLHSFRTLNPDLPVTLYTAPYQELPLWSTSVKQDFSDYSGQDWRDRLDDIGVRVEPFEFEGKAHPNQIADICRWWHLSHGGIFCDMDIIFFRPLTEEHLEVLSGDALTYDKFFSLGMASGKPDSTLFRDVYETSLSTVSPNGYQSSGVCALYVLTQGSDAMTGSGEVNWSSAYAPDDIAILRERYGDVALIPMRWVHQLKPDQPFKEIRLLDCTFPEDVVGIHWYAGHHHSRDSVKKCTPDNIGGGTIGEAIRRTWQTTPSGL